MERRDFGHDGIFNTHLAVGRLKMKPPSRANHPLFSEALGLMRQGHFAAAEASFLRLLKREPRHADACHLAGLAVARLGRPADAAAYLRRAVTINPRNAAAQMDLAQTLMGLGQDEAALTCLDQALALEPKHAQTHYDRGTILLKLKQPEAAIAAFEQATLLQPDFANAHNDLGYALSKAHRPREALAPYQKALSLQPDSIAYLMNTGMALCANKQHAEALPLVDRILQNKPGDDAALILRAEALLGMGQAEEPLKIAEAVLARDPRNLKAYGCHTSALVLLGQTEAALSAAEAGRAMLPDEALAHYNCGYVLLKLNRLAEALSSYEQAMKLDPDDNVSPWGRALTLLALGRFEEGWAAYETRYKVPGILTKRSYPKPLWLGKETLKDKRLYVYWEQGFGDTIQFARYAPLAAAAGAKVAFSVQDPLLRLFKGCFHNITVIGPNEAPTDFDLHCPLLSMPLSFGTRLETIPGVIGGYLKAPAEDVALWQQKLGTAGRRIGLVWSGSQGHLNDFNRSVPLARLQGLLKPGSVWVSLQKEVRETDRLMLEALGLVDPSADLRDFADTAALISALDLVITVDTSVAHLAGALGKPCWVMLPFAPDFRWMMDREDSPWYPGMRLFRQQSQRDWGGVIARISEALGS